MLIFDLHISITLKDAAMIMLPTTATLLGLVYAGLIFWLQSGFAGLEYSASVLRPLITANGKTLLDLLVGATAVSLFALLQSSPLMSVAFWIFVMIFMIDVFKAASAQGYVATVFSTKLVPRNYGPTRKFFRAILNGGPVVWIRIVFFIALCVGYPFGVTFAGHGGLMLTDSAAIVFIFAATSLSLIQIRSLLIQAVEARAQIERQQIGDNERRAWTMDGPMEEWPTEKRELERRIIASELGQVGVLPWTRVESLAHADKWTSRDLSALPVLEHEPWVQEHGNLHLDIVIPCFQTDEATRNFIFHWSRVILEALANSETAVTQYALSFWRHDGVTADAKTHFGMIKAGRSDVLGASSAKDLEDRGFVRKMPGRFLAPGVAEY